MKTHATALCFIALAAHAGAVTILSEPFNSTSSGFVTGWTESGDDLYGGVGVEHQSGGPTDYQAYFQTGDFSNASAGIFRDLGVAGSVGQTITVAFELIGAVGSPFAGAFTASLWDGAPGGTLLASLVPVNPAATVISAQSFNVTLTSNTVGNLYVQFNAADDGSSGGFQQARLDNVLVTAVPEPAATLLGALGVLGLLRRRRA